MASDLISSLNIDSEKQCGKCYIVQSKDGCESTFIVSCLLSHQLRMKNVMILVTMHQSIQHYQDISARMGCNLKECIENKSVVVIDLSSHILETELSGQDVDSSILDKYFTNISYSLEELSKKNKLACVYFEDLTHLLDLGISIADIVKFVKKIQTSLASAGYIFLGVHVSLEADQSYLLANTLRSMGSTFLEICPLTTGRSVEVSGHMKVTHLSDAILKEKIQFDQQSYHFKLFDRGVKVFPPGST